MVQSPIGMVFHRQSLNSSKSGVQGFIGEDVWYPLLDLSEWTPKAHSRTRERPVIGRHSRDCVTKWPEKELDLRNAFLADSDYDVRILGGCFEGSRNP